MAVGQDTHGATRWDFSGFGSAGGQRWYGDRYTSDYGEPPSGEFDPDWDSILGAQLSWLHDSGLGFTAQGVARGHSLTGDDPYQPQTEWFFASWQPSDALRVRVGRLRTPLFMYSESLEVGYAYPWVEPNRHVYKTSYTTASSYDGADVTYSQFLGPAIVTYQLLAGSSRSVLVDNPVQINAARGVAVTAAFDTVTLRYACIRYEVTIENPAADVVANYLEGLTALSPRFERLAESINTTDIPQSTHDIGLRWELDDYTVDAEVIYSVPPGEKLDLESFGAYLGLSRQSGQHTVFGVIGHSFLDLSNDSLKDLAETQAVVPPGANPLLDLVRQGLASTLDGYTASDSSLTLGYRYDITDAWDVKMEVRHLLMNEDFSPEAYITPPEATERGRANILRLVTDWVF